MIGLIRAVLAMGFCLVPTFAWAQGKSVSLVTDHEKHGGFLLAITEAAFKKVGYRVEVEYLPWPRALNNVMNGESEGLLGVYYTPERATRMVYSIPIGSSELSFFKLRSSTIAFETLRDLRGLTIGVVTGASYTPEFDTSPLFKREGGVDVRMNIRKLLAGRVDLVIEKKGVFLHELNREFGAEAGRVVILPMPLKKNAFPRRLFEEGRGGHEEGHGFQPGTGPDQEGWHLPQDHGPWPA